MHLSSSKVIVVPCCEGLGLPLLTAASSQRGLGLSKRLWCSDVAMKNTLFDIFQKGANTWFNMMF